MTVTVKSHITKPIWEVEAFSFSKMLWLHPYCQLSVWVLGPHCINDDRTLLTMCCHGLIDLCCLLPMIQNWSKYNWLCNLCFGLVEYGPWLPGLKCLFLCLYSWEDLTHHQVYVWQFRQHLSGNNTCSHMTEWILINIWCAPEDIFLQALFIAAIFASNCRVNRGVINDINYGTVPFRWARALVLCMLAHWNGCQSWHTK